MSITTISPAQKTALETKFEDYAINKRKNEVQFYTNKLGIATATLGTGALIGGGILLAVVTASTMGIALGVIIALAGLFLAYVGKDYVEPTWNSVDKRAGQDAFIYSAVDIIRTPPAAPAPEVYAGFGYAQPVAQVQNFAAMNNNNRQGFLV